MVREELRFRQISAVIGIQTYMLYKFCLFLILTILRCGHCKKMAPDWETLAAEWEGDAIGLVAEVDCTTEGKPLCEANGVKGFPALKYGDPSALEDYNGGRSLSDFQTFAKGNLKPVCGINNLDLCDDEKKALINGLMAKPNAELESEIKASEKLLEDVEKEFKESVEGLQTTYENLMKTKEAKEEEVKNSGLSLMKAVQKKKASGSDEL